MGIARETFYSSLLTDYNRNDSNSVIYRDITKEHDKLVQQALDNPNPTSIKMSSIIQIKYHWALLMKKKGSPENYLKNLLRILQARPVLYRDTTVSTSLSFMIELIQTGLDLNKTEADHLEHTKNKKKIQAKLTELVSFLESNDINIRNEILSRFEKNHYFNPPYQSLALITEEIVNRATNVEIKAFFYDAGYSLTDYQYGNLSKKPEAVSMKNRADSKKSARNKIDKTLRLMDIFCEQNGYSLFSPNTFPSIEECKTMFSLLKNSDNHNVLIPLRIDPRTGCALYIVGRSFYECLYTDKETFSKTKAFKENNDACAYGILSLYEPFDNSSVAWKIHPDHSIGYMLTGYFDEYSSFEEAFSAYEDDCSDSLLELSETYNQTFPIGYPPIFKQYELIIDLEPTKEDLDNMRFEINRAYQNEFLAEVVSGNSSIFTYNP